MTKMQVCFKKFVKGDDAGEEEKEEDKQVFQVVKDLLQSG